MRLKLKEQMLLQQEKDNLNKDDIEIEDENKENKDSKDQVDVDNEFPSECEFQDVTDNEDEQEEGKVYYLV